MVQAGPLWMPSILATILDVSLWYMVLELLKCS